jgi:hypothetical protein
MGIEEGIGHRAWSTGQEQTRRGPQYVPSDLRGRRGERARDNKSNDKRSKGFWRL